MAKRKKQSEIETDLKSGEEMNHEQISDTISDKHEKEEVEKPIEKQVEPKKEKGFPSLEFAQFGWCREANPPIRYERGFYTPKNRAEYEMLKKYAVVS